MGKIFVTTELGGGGTTSPETNTIAKQGVDNFLQHAGILEKTHTHPLSETFSIQTLTAPVSLNMSGDDCFLFSEHKGVLEPFINLGDPVKKGQLMAQIHEIERTAAPKHDYLAPRDGIVISRHFPSRIQIGDCINVIAEII